MKHLTTRLQNISTNPDSSITPSRKGVREWSRLKMASAVLLVGVASAGLLGGCVASRQDPEPSVPIEAVRQPIALSQEVLCNPRALERYLNSMLEDSSLENMEGPISEGRERGAARTLAQNILGQLIGSEYDSYPTYQTMENLSELLTNGRTRAIRTFARLVLEEITFSNLPSQGTETTGSDAVLRRGFDALLAVVSSEDSFARTIIEESIEIAENPHAGIHSRLRAKGLLLTAADGNLRSLELNTLLFDFFEDNANSSDLEEIRAAIIEYIAHQGLRNQLFSGRTVDVLERALADESPEIRESAVDRLKYMGRMLSSERRRYSGGAEPDSELAIRIVTILGRLISNDELGQAAIFAVGHIGEVEDIASSRIMDRIIDVLERAASSSNWETQCAAAMCLVDLNTDSLTPQQYRRTERIWRQENLMAEGDNCYNSLTR